MIGVTGYEFARRVDDIRWLKVDWTDFHKYVPTQVNTNLSVDPSDAIFDPTGNQCFKIRLGMIGLLSAVKEAEKSSFKSKIWKPKISSFVIKKPWRLLRRNIFQQSRVY